MLGVCFVWGLMGLGFLGGVVWSQFLCVGGVVWVFFCVFVGVMFGVCVF